MSSSSSTQIAKVDQINQEHGLELLSKPSSFLGIPTVDDTSKLSFQREHSYVTIDTWQTLLDQGIDAELTEELIALAIEKGREARHQRLRGEGGIFSSSTDILDDHQLEFIKLCYRHPQILWSNELKELNGLLFAALQSQPTRLTGKEVVDRYSGYLETTSEAEFQLMMERWNSSKVEQFYSRIDENGLLPLHSHG